MAFVEGCKHSLEITVPVEFIERATEKAVSGIQKRAKIAGFRPGKAPASLIHKHFEPEIRQQVIESVIPEFYSNHIKQENLRPITRPNITDVKFEPHQPMQFKVEFEVRPEIELKEYRGLDAPYDEPPVTEEHINAQLESIRERKATFVNVDPRPIEDGDYAVVSLKSIHAPEPMEADETTVEVGGRDTLEGFTENLRGMSPGDEKDFDVVYPESESRKNLAGKTVRFHAVLKGIRRKELPEINDELAQDVGDFRNLDELKEGIRKSAAAAFQTQARNVAKKALMDRIVSMHDFPVPEVMVENHIHSTVEAALSELVPKGMDISKLPLDWKKIHERERPRAINQARSVLILEKIAEQEGVQPLQTEVDTEVARVARERREPLAVARPKMEEDGTIDRIAYNIRVEKTLQFLFDHATKITPAEYAEKYPEMVAQAEAEVNDDADAAEELPLTPEPGTDTTPELKAQD